MRGVVVFFASAIFVIALELIGSPQVSAGGPVKVCGPADPDSARCHAQLQPGRLGDLAQSAPYGLSPAQIKSAYGFSTSSTAGTGKTIAIVDAYNDPTAESDLAVFSSQYGLPACTTANGCFTKVNQTGGTRYPRTDSGWALEISSSKRRPTASRTSSRPRTTPRPTPSTSRTAGAAASPPVSSRTTRTSSRAA